MTPQQQKVLDLIRKINDGEFAGFFEPSYVMAWCQVESAFRPRAYRWEPRLQEASYGLMQVLESTAKGIDSSIGSMEELYDPECGLRIGMKVAKQYFDILDGKFGRDPSLEEWCDSYNRGPGGSQLGDDDHAYVKVWMAAQEFWASQGIDR